MNRTIAYLNEIGFIDSAKKNLTTGIGGRTVTESVLFDIMRNDSEFRKTFWEEALATALDTVWKEIEN